MKLKPAQIIQRPWGEITQIVHNQIATVNVIKVKAGQRLSLQSHNFRDELWFFITDNVKVEIQDDVIYPEIGEIVLIPQKIKHRLSSISADVIVIEIALGNYDINDITRFEDDFNR